LGADAVDGRALVELGGDAVDGRALVELGGHAVDGRALVELGGHAVDGRALVELGADAVVRGRREKADRVGRRRSCRESFFWERRGEAQARAAHPLGVGLQACRAR
jgi:hypothetical protein